MVRRTAAALAFAVLVLASTAAAQTPNLVARYHLDGAGTDSSGNGLDAVPAGSPEGIADGRFGTAFRFGDARDAFSAPSNPLLQPARVTLAAWVRASAVPSQVKSIVSQGAQPLCDCDGTLTQVTKGRVTVRADRTTRIIRAGGRYLIKARLFAARRSS
jgi:hypothetical protein